MKRPIEDSRRFLLASTLDVAIRQVSRDFEFVESVSLNLSTREELGSSKFLFLLEIPILLDHILQI